MEGCEFYSVVSAGYVGIVRIEPGWKNLVCVFSVLWRTTMYNCIPMHTLQTMQDMQSLSRGALGLTLAGTGAFVAFLVAIAVTI